MEKKVSCFKAACRLWLIFKGQNCVLNLIILATWSTKGLSAKPFLCYLLQFTDNCKARIVFLFEIRRITNFWKIVLSTLRFRIVVHVRLFILLQEWSKIGQNLAILCNKSKKLQSCMPLLGTVQQFGTSE